MGPIAESGFQPGWSGSLRVRLKGEPRDPDVDPLPYKAKSLVVMLRRKLEAQQAKRVFYYRGGKMIEQITSRKSPDTARGSVDTVPDHKSQQ